MWIIKPIPEIISLTFKAFIKGKQLQIHTHTHTHWSDTDPDLTSTTGPSQQINQIILSSLYIPSGNDDLLHRFGAADTLLCSSLKSFSTWPPI